MSAMQQPVFASENDVYIAIGEDLKGADLDAVCEKLDVDIDVTAENIIYVSNAEEHEYLDEYLDADSIGSRALSSAVLILEDEGYGISVETFDIDFCTPGMYENALYTAGLRNASVKIAGPFPISGTAALIGVMKAYALMNGTELDKTALDAALNEIVLTGELENSSDDTKVYGIS